MNSRAWGIPSQWAELTIFSTRTLCALTAGTNAHANPRFSSRPACRCPDRESWFLWESEPGLHRLGHMSRRDYKWGQRLQNGGQVAA